MLIEYFFFHSDREENRINNEFYQIAGKFDELESQSDVMLWLNLWNWKNASILQNTTCAHEEFNDA